MSFKKGEVVQFWWLKYHGPMYRGIVHSIESPQPSLEVTLLGEVGTYHVGSTIWITDRICVSPTYCFIGEV